MSVVVVGMKIASSRDLRVCAWCNYNISRDIYGKLPSVLFKLQNMVHKLQIMHFPSACLWFTNLTHSDGRLVYCSCAVDQTIGVPGYVLLERYLVKWAYYWFDSEVYMYMSQNEVRVDIWTMGSHFGENFFCSSQSAGISYKCRNFLYKCRMFFMELLPTVWPLWHNL